MGTDFDPGAVKLVSLCDDEHGFTASYNRSLLPLLDLDLGYEKRIWRGGYIFQQVSSTGVVEGRNGAAKAFLEGRAEWLWFVDSDMGFDSDALEHLIAAADPVDRPIMGGLCFGLGALTSNADHGQSVVKNPFPTIYDLVSNPDDPADVAFRSRWNYLPNTVQRCAATGTGCLLIHRSVLEVMQEKFGPEWFSRLRPPGGSKLFGEDTSFCWRAAMLDIPVHVNSRVKTSHLKPIYVTESLYMQQVIAMPATDPTAVIVPVLQRPQNAEPFMLSLRASTGLAEVYAIVEEDDVVTQDAWREAGASLVVTNVHTFAEKVNVGYQNTDEPWLFLVGDDVRFHPGWLDHAQHVAKATGASVVGTNDLATKVVMDGDHATHILIARDYIAETGASWDYGGFGGPGVVCAEAYRHMFVDNEIVTAAKQRGVFAPALASIVEHIHPVVKKTEMDPVYELGAKNAGKDKITWLRRSKANAA